MLVVRSLGWCYNFYINISLELSQNIHSTLGNLKKGWEKTFFRPYVTEIMVGDTVALFRVEGSTSKMESETLGREGDSLAEFLLTSNGNECILDIGARHGLYSLLSAVKNSSDRVIAIEPDPDNCRLLAKNITLNNLGNVAILPLAISNDDGRTILLTSGAEGKSPRLDTVKKRQADLSKFKRKIGVESRTLDSLVEFGTIPVPNIIKVDIEGAECFMLEGAKKLFSGQFGSRPQHLFIELHRALIPEPYSVESIERSLNELGYHSFLGNQSERTTESLRHFVLSG